MRNRKKQKDIFEHNEKKEDTLTSNETIIGNTKEISINITPYYEIQIKNQKQQDIIRRKKEIIRNNKK